MGIKHYRKPDICRVRKHLPCAQTRAHGKLLLCHVPTDSAHGESFAHGKQSICQHQMQYCTKHLSHLFFQPGAHHIQSRTADAWSERDATTTRTPAPSYRQPNLVKHLARPPHHVNPMPRGRTKATTCAAACQGLVPVAVATRPTSLPNYQDAQREVMCSNAREAPSVHAPGWEKKITRARVADRPASLAPGPATQGRS